MAKSPNKHNRLYAKAQPLHEKLPDAIEKGDVSFKDDVKSRAKKLNDDFDWDKNDALKIWCFGPENQGANILADKTTGVQYMNELRESMESAF